MAANFLIALGSNRRHGRCGSPTGVVRAALDRLTQDGVSRVVNHSRLHVTKPLGPGGRSYVNAVAAVESRMGVEAMLYYLQWLEWSFGRRGGRRWGARVLDLDLLGLHRVVLPSPLGWRRAASGLIVPHPRLHLRAFVLDPLLEVAPDWRHPMLGATVRQLHARLHRRRATPSSSG